MSPKLSAPSEGTSHSVRAVDGPSAFFENSVAGNNLGLVPGVGWPLYPYKHACAFCFLCIMKHSAYCLHYNLLYSSSSCIIMLSSRLLQRYRRYESTAAVVDSVKHVRESDRMLQEFLKGKGATSDSTRSSSLFVSSIRPRRKTVGHSSSWYSSAEVDVCSTNSSWVILSTIILHIPHCHSSKTTTTRASQTSVPLIAPSLTNDATNAILGRSHASTFELRCKPCRESCLIRLGLLLCTRRCKICSHHNTRCHTTDGTS